MIERSPAPYWQLVKNLSANDLAKTYREGSWTVQQLVHQVSDIALLPVISYFHPTPQIHIDQAQTSAMQAWHVQHHLAHIELALTWCCPYKLK